MTFTFILPEAITSNETLMKLLFDGMLREGCLQEKREALGAGREVFVYECHNDCRLPNLNNIAACLTGIGCKEFQVRFPE